MTPRCHLQGINHQEHLRERHLIQQHLHHQQGSEQRRLLIYYQPVTSPEGLSFHDLSIISANVICL